MVFAIASDKQVREENADKGLAGAASYEPPGRELTHFLHKLFGNKQATPRVWRNRILAVGVVCAAFLGKAGPAIDDALMLINMFSADTEKAVENIFNPEERRIPMGEALEDAHIIDRSKVYSELKAPKSSALAGDDPDPQGPVKRKFIKS